MFSNFKSKENPGQTLTLFEDSGFDDEFLNGDPERRSISNSKVDDPYLDAALLIAKRLKCKSKGKKISAESRRAGREICDHLIASLQSHPIQSTLHF